MSREQAFPVCSECQEVPGNFENSVKQLRSAASAPVVTTPHLNLAAFIFSHFQTMKIWGLLSVTDVEIVTTSQIIVPRAMNPQLADLATSIRSVSIHHLGHPLACCRTIFMMVKAMSSGFCWSP